MGFLNAHADDFEKVWPGKILWNCSMARYTTLRVGGPAEAVVFADTIEGLRTLLLWLNDNDIPRYLVGNGSNILVPDAGLQGVVIMFGQGLAMIERIKENEETAEIQAGAGCGLGKLITHCAENGLAGLEFLAGIPGTVGGSIVMNAGCWGKEISDVLTAVTSINATGKLVSRSRSDLNFSYRTWGEEKDTVVVAGSFLLTKDSAGKIKERSRTYRKRRQQKQPQHVASAGSFFKNPEGHSAGKLIDEAGLKGLRVGGAEVSGAHANFIVNTGTATAGDILELMNKIQTRVYEQSGIMLEPEVHIFSKSVDC
jgi:UDP-N-acetylmuramate dehydrogenase